MTARGGVRRDPCSRRAPPLFRTKREEQMLIEAQNIYFDYAGSEVLRDVDFSVEDGERVGIVGDNGSGKTTLLNILCGELAPVRGTVNVARNVQTGYLKQTSGLDGAATVLTEMKSVRGSDKILARMKQLERTMGEDPSLIEEYSRLCSRYDAVDGYNLDHNIKKVLGGMNFGADTYEKPVAVLSGGEKTRLAMAKLLLWNPDVIVLDEPTNHLDMDTSAWLQEYLQNYDGAVVVVSHDRGFLDAVCTRIFEIENHAGHSWPGNYANYARLKREYVRREQKVSEQTEKTARKLEDYARRNIVRASSSKMAKSRLKMLGRLERTAPENHCHEKITFRFPPVPEPYKDVLTVKNLSVSVAGRRLFDSADFILQRGERLAVTGENGCGKTTLLRVITQELAPESGRAELGGGVRSAYFRQNVFTDEQRDAIHYIWDSYPALTQQQIRDLLAGVGLRGDEIFIPLSGLSGGERARLMLCKLSLDRPNVILLDEPTNHLDVYSRETLSEALASYAGTIITVSHDRDFIAALGAKVLNIENGKAQLYENLEMYDRRGRRSEPRPLEAQADKAANSQKERRQQAAKQRERRGFLEHEIEYLENEVREIEAQLSDAGVASDAEKVQQLCERLNELNEYLDEYSKEWFALSESAQ